jgi:hypothetical protein
MFEMMIAKKIMMENANYNEALGLESSYTKSVQFKPNLLDRVLPVLGQAMITAGLKLKYRQHFRLTTQDANTPHFLIML